MCAVENSEKYKGKYFCNVRTTESTKEYINLSYMLNNDMQNCLYNIKNNKPAITPSVDISKFTIEYIPELLNFISSVEFLNKYSILQPNQLSIANNFLENIYTKIDTIYFINEPYRIYILLTYDNQIIVFRDEFNNTLKFWCSPKIYDFPNRKFIYKMSVNMDTVNCVLNEIIIKKEIKTVLEIHQSFQIIFDTINTNQDTKEVFTIEKYNEYCTFIIKKILKFLPSSSMIYGIKLPVPKFHSLSECE
jgi:hypothetical protein